MGKVKEHERELIINSATHYLCDQEEGDLYDAYQKLQTASKKGMGDKCASDFVDVWQPLEDKTVDEMLEYIDSGKTEVDDKNPIRKIDFTELRNQKSTLLRTISGMLPGKEQDNLQSIVHLIDAIQDYAVDVLNLVESVVFDVEEM